MSKTLLFISALVLFALAMHNTVNGKPADAYVAALWVLFAIGSKGE